MFCGLRKKIMSTLYTIEEEIEAFVGHVLVDQDLLFLLNATPENTNKVFVLKPRDEVGFGLELLLSLSGVLREPFHRHLVPIQQCPLNQFSFQFFNYDLF